MSEAGRRLMAVDVACNDPDNGNFAGRTMMVQVGEMEIEADNWAGYAFSVLDSGQVRLHRRAFSFVDRKFWMGNWCWDRFWMRRSEAKRFLGMLRDSGRWRCTSAPCRLYDWFNREGQFAARPAPTPEDEG